MEQRNMMENVSDLSAEGFVKNQARRALIERWQKWIPAKVKDAHQKWVMAQLFENQLGEIKQFKEKHLIGEDTTTANTAPFIKYTFPLLRRVFPSLIAPEIVSVQPMSGPVGAVFYFELKYGDSKGSTQAGQRLVKDFAVGYSSEKVDAEIIGSGDGSVKEFDAILSYQPVRANSVEIKVGSIIVKDNGAGLLTGTGVAAGSTINYATGAIHLVLVAAPASMAALTASYEYNLESNAKVPSVNVDIALVAVTAKSRKLKALWSSEAADDLKALHGVDAEQELVAGVGSELALEIDREIIEDLRAGATGALASYNMQAPSGIRELDHIRGLLTPVTLAANQIGKNTMRGPANFLIMSYDAASYIEQLGTDAFYRPVFAGDKDAMGSAEAPQNWGVMKMGTLQSRFVCYKDPYMKANEILLGYKGNSFVDAGYVYAPYVAMQTTGTFLDPNDFKSRKGLRTRYAKLMARPEFYGKVTLSNLTSIAPGAFGPV